MFHKKTFCPSLALALATVVTGTLSEVASAATFNFSYTTNGTTIAATIDGILQADNNTVFVTSTALRNPTVNGTPAPALSFLGSYVDSILNGNVVTGQGVLTLDGSGLDFIACDEGVDGQCTNGFGFLPAGIIAPFPLVVSTPSYGIGFQVYDPAGYSLTPVVPEPSTVVGLAVIGVGFLASKRRKSA